MLAQKEKSSSLVLSFEKNGYDPFIDFLKGVCIVLVVITHCLPSVVEKYTLFHLWGRTAVPIFLIIQVFHAYKHGLIFRLPKITKLWNRIARPFIITQLAIAVFLFLFSKNISVSIYLNRILDKGYGPGEYYPWIYLQFALILPLLSPVIKKLGKPWKVALFFILVSQLFEFLCCLINPQEWPFYSRSFFRYFFLIYLGYIAAATGFSINRKTFLLSLLSLAATIFFVFFNYNLEPFFFKNYQWHYCHWPCYFYIAYLFIFILNKFYTIAKTHYLSKFIIRAGKYSYEIFLFQMFYFIICGSHLKKIIGSITNLNIASGILFILISILSCVLIPLAFEAIKERNSQKNK
ncbi:MAG: acyltransferase [Fibrobacter sp.]|nr:acyltransferase [Fibrobacter sp.]